jgi:hypothetical protein
MLNFIADPRDGNAASGTCATCCCKDIKLRPGESNLVQINYAPWSAPLGGNGLVGEPRMQMEHNDSACSNNPLKNTNYSATTALNTAVALNLTTGAGTGTFQYAIVDMFGPENGKLTDTGTAGNGQYTYTPNTGFTGYDYFSYLMRDAAGNMLIRHVSIKVGTDVVFEDPVRMALTPFIKTGTFDVMAHTLKFPLHMPINVRACDSYKLTFRQEARDCAGNSYYHAMCFNILPTSC